MPTPRPRLAAGAVLAMLVGGLVGALAAPLGEDRVLGRVASPPRPNVVLIMVDDMRQDDLRFMPRTERLIGDAGVRFANSFSPHPLCCPARASVLTGLYTHNHGVYDVVPPWGFTSFDDDSTLATWLEDDGYTTSYLGKYLNGYGWMPEPGRTHGTSVHYVPPGWTQWRASIDGGLPPTHWAAGGTYRYDDTTLSVDGKRFANFEGHYQSRVYGRISARTVERLARRAPPYFLYVSYAAPHHGLPIEPDDPGSIRGDDGLTRDFLTPARPPAVRGAFDAVVRRAPGADWRPALATGKPEYLRDRPRLNDAERRALTTVTRQRAEALAVVDRQVGRTIRALAGTGELDQTLVIFTSDNGFFLGEQGVRTGKILPHEPSLRVPLLMRGPGIPAGETRRDPFLSIDFAPTIAAATGTPVGHEVDGADMLGVARNGDQGWTRAVLTATNPRGSPRETDLAGRPLSRRDPPGAHDLRWAIGIRTDRYLYVDIATGEEELYDLRTDPEEYHDVADRPGYREVRALLRQELGRMRDCDGAECRAALPPELRTAPP